ncbi:MAG: hypothetical protein KDB03_15450 [Planctomycetales bacterium]|nr:hypothetical protein [Planctomycetales bacterium]
MELQDLHQALQDLPVESHSPSATQVKKLGNLIDGELPLQSFLEQLLPQLCDLFAAPAAVIWMKAQGSPGAVFGVRYQMDQLLNSINEQKKHERLVQLAWQQKQPLLAEPSHRKLPSTSIGTENPTGFPLLFGPILHYGDPLALLEIALNPTQNPLQSDRRQIYLRTVQIVAERVYGGLRRRIAMPAASIERASEILQSLEGEVEAQQELIRRAIESRLQQFHGWSFGSLTENQTFAKSVHQLLDSHGLRVQCPECGHPAILRCLRAGNAKHGVFVFDHYLDSGRTFHGGPTTMPRVQVVPKPARRIALNNSTTE